MSFSSSLSLINKSYVAYETEWEGGKRELEKLIPPFVFFPVFREEDLFSHHSVGMENTPVLDAAYSHAFICLSFICSKWGSRFFQDSGDFLQTSSPSVALTRLTLLKSSQYS